MGSDSDERRVVVQVRGGASLVQCRPVFTRDSKYVLCPSGHHVKIFAVASGDCARELRGHTDLVTGIQLNPKNHFQVLTSSADGSVKQWDLLDGALLKSHDFRQPLYGFYALPGSAAAAGPSNGGPAAGPSVLAIVQQSRSAYEAVRTVLTNDEGDLRCETIFRNVQSQESHLAVGGQGELAAYVFGRVLGVYSFPRRCYQEQKLTTDEEFTCIACHPSEQCVVTGTSVGRIYYWYKLFGGNNVIRTSYHWHSLPVLDLAFTAEGSCLLSGGHECVLVKWQYGSQQKDFLPRLGGPIIRLSCSSDSTAYAVCHSDNVIQVISNGFVVQQVFQGLTRDHLTQNITRPLPAGLLLDPRTGSLVTNGKPGHLQFFSLAEDKLVYNLDIVGHNYVSSSSLKQPLLMTQVECADFDSVGTWLATVERRADSVTADEIRLKFWEFRKESQTYVLNTDINLPHSKKVNCVRFGKAPIKQDGCLTAVTTSADGRFKLWSLVDNTDIYRKSVCWRCDSVGYYKGLSCGDACFSDDGSLLAVSFEHSATLWDPEANALKVTLPAASLTKGSQIRQLLFGAATSSHLLVLSTDVSLTVWNLLSCSVLWTTAILQPQLVVRDPHSQYMALFTAGRSAVIFVPSDLRPVHVQHDVTPANVVAAMFVPCPHAPSRNDEHSLLPWQIQSRLYYMDSMQMLLTLDTDEDAGGGSSDCAASGQKVSKEPMQENVPATPFSLLIGAERKPEQAASGQQWKRSQGPLKQLVQQMMNTPAHVQPPVALLCRRFVAACVLGRGNEVSGKSVPEGNSSDDDEDGDHSMDEMTAEAKNMSDDTDDDTDTRTKTLPRGDADVSRGPAGCLAHVEQSDLLAAPPVDPATVGNFDWLANEAA